MAGPEEKKGDRPEKKPEDFASDLEGQTLIALLFEDAKNVREEERELDEQMDYLEREGRKLDATLPGLPVSGETINNIRAALLRVSDLMGEQIMQNNTMRRTRIEELQRKGLWTSELVREIERIHPGVMNQEWRDRMADRIQIFARKYYKRIGL